MGDDWHNGSSREVHDSVRNKLHYMRLRFTLPRSSAKTKTEIDWTLRRASVKQRAVKLRASTCACLDAGGPTDARRAN